MSKATVDALVKRGIGKKLAEKIAKHYSLKDLKKISYEELEEKIGKDAKKVFEKLGMKEKIKIKKENVEEKIRRIIKEKKEYLPDAIIGEMVKKIEEYNAYDKIKEIVERTIEEYNKTLMEP